MGSQQGRGTIALLMVVAAATVVALFVVLRWDGGSLLPASLRPESSKAVREGNVPAAEAPTSAGLDAGQAKAEPGPSSAAAPQPTAPRQEASLPAPAASASTAQSPAGGTLSVAAPAEPVRPEPAKAAKLEADPIAPSFDVVRIEPDGESVIAGRGAPGATIELLRNGQVHARVAADASGLFAFVPPTLPPGSHQITLRSIAPDGTRRRSREAVSIVIAEGGKARPLVALTSPDKPTVVLSSPEPAAENGPVEAEVQAGQAPAAAAPAATAEATVGNGKTPERASRNEVKIVTVESEQGGRLFVSGKAVPGATVRLYLNDTFIAPGGAGGDGKVTFSIGRGIVAGDYRIRLDEVDPVSGSVKSRAEVAFNVPHAASVERVSAQAAPSASGAIQQAPQADAEPKAGQQVASALPDGHGLPPSQVLIPDVNTTIISRGDSLWRLSQRVYGEGLRYTVIYGANRSQIRNPDLIYPGQVFVLPSDPQRKAN
jgi:nucleoid-associated protein YgaU